MTFCVVDLETTGGAETDMITEVGAVKVRGGEVLGEFQTLVNPQAQIPPLIAVLTGITNQMVAERPGAAPGAAGVPGVRPGNRDRGPQRAVRRRLPAPRLRGLRVSVPALAGVDTAALARQILLRDEVPNCRLATLARHFHAAVTPNHRALTDAQATVDVLHGLIERVGNLGVHTLEDLAEFSRRVSPQRRAKRTWAAALPDRPGVYLFVAEHDQQRHVLYVGKSKNIRARVRTYFTAAEKRPRIDEMVRLATGVEAVPCLTPLQADVTELRLIGSHAPRYNRRSKFPERTQWIKITDEAFPRLSVVRAVRDDGATYFGPFSRRQAAEDVVLAIYDGFPIRQCTPRLSATAPTNACALAGMGRCCAPCDGTISRDGYGEIVERVRRRLVARRPAGGARRPGSACSGWSSQQRFEEAATIRRRLETLVRTAARFHRVRSLAGCPEIVARPAGGPELGDPRDPLRPAGRYRVATPREVPQAVARAVRATAETVVRPPGPTAGGRHRGDRADRRLAGAARRTPDRDHRRLDVAAARGAGPRSAGAVRAR